MANNTTDPVVDSSTQFGLSYMCSLLGIFAWQREYLTPTTFITSVFAISVEALTCPFTILLNALVILAVKRKRYLRRKKSCLLLACLAATDLLVGAVLLPLVITGHVLRVLGVGPICLMDKIALEMSYMACGSSLCHLVIVSGERYIAIKHALRYETLVTTRRLTTAVAVAWAVSVIYVVVPVAFSLAHEALLGDQLVGMSSSFLISSGVLVILFCQVALFLESRRHRKDIRAQQVSEASAKEFLKKDKAARTTTFIVVALCLCFLPQVLFYAVAVDNMPRSLAIGFMHVIEWLLYSNSLITPIIYCVRMQEFQRAFKELLNFRDSSVNTEFEMNTVGISGGQRKDSKACIDYLHKKQQMAWPDPTSPRASLSRSLDL